MKHPLAIVGASARAAAASAVRAGFQPLAADLFADADLRAIATATRISPYPEGLLDWLRAIEPPAWMYTGALENHPDLIDQMAWIAPLWGNPGDVLQRVRSPWELQNVLRHAGLLFPETRESADGLPLDGSWLAKTYRGASGSGVRPVMTSLSDWEGSLERTRIVYQRRIPGVSCAAAYAAWGDCTDLLGVTRQITGESWLGAHGFQYAGSIGPLPIDETTAKTVARLGEVVAQQFELAGVFGIDFILNDEGIWPLEVNPRYTASMEICERITGRYTLHDHCIAWYEPEFAKMPAARRENPDLSHGKAILFAKRDVALSHAFVDMALEQAMTYPWPMLADISPPDMPIEAGRPILTLFAEGNNVEEVEQQLRQRAAQLERQIYGSSDIP